MSQACIDMITRVYLINVIINNYIFFIPYLSIALDTITNKSYNRIKDKALLVHTRVPSKILRDTSDRM